MEFPAKVVQISARIFPFLLLSLSPSAGFAKHSSMKKALKILLFCGNACLSKLVVGLPSYCSRRPRERLLFSLEFAQKIPIFQKSAPFFAPPVLSLLVLLRPLFFSSVPPFYASPPSFASFTAFAHGRGERILPGRGRGCTIKFWPKPFLHAAACLG